MALAGKSNGASFTPLSFPMSSARWPIRLTGQLPPCSAIFPDSYNEQDTGLSKAMSAAWVRFAKTGDPNGQGLAAWPRFSDGKESYLEFGDQIAAKTALRKKPLVF